MIERLKLFNNKKEIAIFLAFSLLILLINIIFKYQTYQNLKNKNVVLIKANILNQY